MKASHKNWLILILAATTTGSAYWGWQQVQELESLRHSKSGKTTHRVVPSQVGDQTVSSPSLREEDSVAKENNSEAPTPTVVAEPQSNRQFRRAIFREAIDTPEFKSLQSLVRKGALDKQYATLFNQLNLSPVELDLLKNLLVEKQNTRTDVIAAARAEGFNFRENRDAIADLMKANLSEIDDAIRDQLGDQVYSTYQKYETDTPYRSVVHTLGQRLSYTANPLTPTQQTQLVDLLSRTSPSANVTSPSQGRLAGQINFRFGATTTSLTQEALDQARGLMSPSQYETLDLMYHEQQAATKMSDIVRSKFESLSADSN